MHRPWGGNHFLGHSWCNTCNHTVVSNAFAGALIIQNVVTSNAISTLYSPYMAFY